MSDSKCRVRQHAYGLLGLALVSVALGCEALSERESHGVVDRAGLSFMSSVSAGVQGPVGGGSFAPIARAVTPAVVAIESELSEGARAQTRIPGMQPRARPRATGTGFLVTRDGYILTNNYLVQNARRVVVGLVDRRILPARVIGSDPSTDVALLKVEGSNFPTITLGNDEAVQVGDQVLAVGNPLGLNFTVTTGIISAKGRSGSLVGLFESNYAVVDFLQTDAAINPGNSGGPLVDMQGNAIGINSAIASPTGVYAGYGFAVPISIARIVMDELRQHGRVRRAILGVSIQDVGPADAQAAGLREIRGVLVGGFSGPNSPSQRAGLQLGDVILAINGRNVDRVSDLQRTLFRFEPGERVSVSVQRFGTQRTLDVTLGEAPRERVATGDVARPESNAPRRQLGIGVEPLTPDIARQLEIPSNVTGLVVAEVDPSGPASGRLIEGDVITGALVAGRQRTIRNVEDLRSELTRASSGVVSLVVYSPRARGTRVVNMQLAR